MSQLHRTERHTRCWPEFRDRHAGAQRRHGRAIVADALEDIADGEYRLPTAADDYEPPCSGCGEYCDGLGSFTGAA